MPEAHEIQSPYPGLRPFEPHEAAIFFGRERHVGRLLEIFLRERFLAVIGPSGSGPYDPESIMSYAHPSSWFTDGREVKGGKTLSESDKRFIAELYPRDRPPK